MTSIPSQGPVPASAPDPCAPETGPAATVLRAFRAELLSAAGKDSQAFRASFRARVGAFRDKNRIVLAEHATWSLRRLPVLALPNLDAMPDDPRVAGDVVARMRGILGTDADPQSPTLQAAVEVQLGDPIRAVEGIRTIVVSAAGGAGDVNQMREGFLEGLAPPPTVRLNDDMAHPVLAVPKRADVFVVWFDRDDRKGGFVPKRIRWVRREPPLEPGLAVTTAEDVFQSFTTAVEAGKGEADDTDANLPKRTLAQVGEHGKRWLNPHAALLRAYGACVCKRVPGAGLPNLAAWKDVEGLWNLVLDTSMFPRLRWDPLRAFLFLRDTIASQISTAGEYASRALVDSIAPPTVYRASDDPNNPVLYLEEGDAVIIVAFSSLPEGGFSPTQVRYLRRN